MTARGNGSTVTRAGIVGSGAWGTALALSLRRAGLDVLMWSHDGSTARAINETHVNPVYLPGVALDPAIRATPTIADLADVDVALLVTPAAHLRAVAGELAKVLASPAPAVVICTKGIEQSSGLLMSQIVESLMPEALVCVLSGPSFAREVAQNLPVALTFASKDEARGRTLMMVMAHKTFRLYFTTDIIGTQVGGAVKNVLAIAAGIVIGRKLGANAHAALTTRGFAELARFGVRLGASFETLTGLSGLGDLILTCSSPQSRNMSLGLALGEGRALHEILAERKAVTEGVYSARSIVELAGQLGVEMPICHAVHEVINGHKTIAEATEALLSRPFKAETETAQSSLKNAELT